MLKRILNIVDRVFILLVVTTYLLLLLETYFYHGFIGKHFLIDARLFMVFTIFFSLVAMPSRNNRVFRFNKYLFLPISVIYLIMKIAELVNYPNYFFSSFHLQPDNFFFVSVFCVSLLLPSISTLWSCSSDAIKDFFRLIIRLSKISRKKAVILVFIPLLLLSIVFSLKRWAGPYWVGSNYDPEYVYLLNSLNMTQFKGVGHTDHPGTPLQMMGAGILVTTHLFRQGKGLVLDVLSNPEYYLNTESYFLIFLIAASVFLIGVFTTSLTRSLMYGIIMQLTPFLSTTLLYVLYRVSPEPLLLLGGLWYSFSILYFYYIPKYKLRHVIFISIISGFLIATKINAAPLIILPLILFPFKAKITYLFGTFVSFILFTLPIHNSYLNFAKWIYKLFSHASYYGEGASTIIDFRSFFTNFITIFTSEYLLSAIILGVAIVLILYFKNRKTLHSYRFLTGLFFTFVAQIFIVSKHFHFHYLVPTLSLLGVASVIFLSLFNLNSKRWYLVIKYVFVISVFTFAARNLDLILKSTRGISERYSESLKIDALIKNDYSNYIMVAYYRSSSQEYALSFGDGYAFHFYEEELSGLYSNRELWNTFHASFYDWSRPIGMPDGSKILFRESTWDINARFKTNLKFKEVYHGVFENLYTLN